MNVESRAIGCRPHSRKGHQAGPQSSHRAGAGPLRGQDRSWARRLPWLVLDDCRRRDRERSTEAPARGQGGWRAGDAAGGPAASRRVAEQAGRAFKQAAVIARELAVSLVLARDDGLPCRSRRTAAGWRERCSRPARLQRS